MSLSLRKGDTPNETTVEISGVRVYFSYETPVAFDYGGERCVRENIWSTTTGKHLNRIDGGSSHAKAQRVPSDEFYARLDNALKGVLR